MPIYSIYGLSKDSFDGALPKSASDVFNNSNYDYKICTRCGEWPSLAAYIVESFGITIDPSSRILGGSCSGYDIKMQDAYSMIKLSLAYGLSCSELWECYINEYGNAEFIVVGEEYGDGFAGDLGTVYLSVAAINYSLMTDRILLTGYKPAQERRLAGPVDLHTLAAYTSGSSHDSSATKYSDGSSLNLYSTVQGSSMPVTEGWRRVGHIDWENKEALEIAFGVGNHASPTAKPYESIASYAYRSRIPHVCDPESTTMSYTEEGPRFEELTGGFSDNFFVSWWNVDQTNPDGSWSGGTAIPHAVLDADTPYPGKWLGVQEVYVYGYKLDNVDIGEDINGNKIATVYISTQRLDLMALSRGQDYIVVNRLGTPTIVFGNYLTEEFNDFYSGGSVGVQIADKCLSDGKLKDGRVPEENASGGSLHYAPLEEMYMFPVGNGSTGYAIKSVVIASKHAYPVIQVSDTKGELSQDYMSEAQIYAYAIVMNDEPAPIIFATSVEVSNSDIGGTKYFAPGCHILDQSDQEPDDDPFGDLQQFWDNEVQAANESMGAGDIKLTLPFFEEDELCTIAENVLEIAQEGRVTIPGSLGYEGFKEVMFTCGPDAHPRLGQKITFEGNTYYVNEINYSYQDSSQYVVNVTAGAKWVGSVFGGGWGEAINQLKVENVTREGRVVAAGSSGAEFIVNISGFGNLACVNTTSMGTIISTGDSVMVTIYNVPQGEV